MPLPNGSTFSDVDAVIEPLRTVECSYFTVTQPGSSTPKGGTSALAQYIRTKYGFEVMPHLTGGCQTPPELENRIQELSYLGIENILALRGDGQLVNGVNRSGVEIVQQLAKVRVGKYLHREVPVPYDFCLAVPCYPEGHPATTREQCWDDFRKKIDLGANLAFTQTVFLPEKYHQILEWAQKNNLTIPIIPGIFIPRTPQDFSFLQGKRVGVTVPPKLLALAERFSASPSSFEAAVDDYIFSLNTTLLAHAPGLHFYSMNRTARIAKIIRSLT